MEYLILLSLLYFAPTAAAARGRRGSFFIWNLFVGWTLIGWVILLGLAVRSRERAKEARHYE